jgi:serine/threonine-protein kinase
MLEQLGHYKILDRIGAGGMGEVYRARDTRLGRTVAIKVLPEAVASDPARRERFMRDAQAAAALSHPNIAALYEVGEDGGHLFLAFEFVPGEPLRAVIAGRPMNPSRAVGLAVQVADALAEAHAVEIVHRDIKPDNIVVTPKGNAKILDFGLAGWTTGGALRDQAAAPASPAATAGASLDTLAYLSPEQAAGGPVDERTDIFSLGIVLCEMLTGKPAFSGATPLAVTQAVVQSPTPLPSTIVKDLPRELDPIVVRATTKAVDRRYESAATLAAELRAVDAILEVRSERLEREGAVPIHAGPRRSSGKWAVIGIAILLGILAVAAWYR